MTMAFEALRALLLSSGYELHFQEQSWVQCLLTRGEEVWLGQGPTQAQALRHAVNQACPSALAQELINKAIAERSTGASASHVGALSNPVPTPVSSPISSPVSNPMSNPMSNPVSSSIGSSIGSTGSAVERPIPVEEPERVSAPASRSSSSNGRARYPVRSEPPPLVRRDSTPPRADLSRSVEELDILMERIRDAREELGLCAPERQRLAILAWICEARSHTDAFPDNARIRDEVAGVSRLLTEIGKSFWPGSVTALQLQMQPRDLPRHLLGGSAATWARAAELAERALQSQEYADERRGYDLYGWADAPHTLPVPESPEAVLDKLTAEVEGFGGGLERQAEPREPDLRPDPETFVRWVRQLRWIRGAELSEPELWARVAGRLRWWSNRRDPQLSSAVRELDASYAPKSAWAFETGCTMFAHRADNARLVSAELASKAQATVRGRKMVIVSHRRDPDLQTELNQALQGSSIQWCVAEPRRVQELGEEITQKSYDLVLGAIGLQSPTVDQILARACRGANITYIRVNKGRIVTCLRHLSRAV